MSKITVVCHKDHENGYEDYAGICLLCEIEKLKKQIDSCAEVAKEPVGVFREDDDIGHVDLIPHQQMKLRDGDKLYTTPPQRTWVGLTDEEIESAIPYKNLSGEYYYDDVLNIVLLIQAKLKRKNI